MIEMIRKAAVLAHEFPQWLLIYWAAINLAAYISFAMDKQFAVKRRERVPEISLLALTALGGAMGALAAMLRHRHKTRKPKFLILVPLLLALQIALAAALIYFG